MSQAAVQWLGRSIMVVAAAVVLNGCTEESPLSPNEPDPTEGVVATEGEMASVHGLFEAGVCSNLRVEAGAKFMLLTYAKGDQIYRWNGTAWVFEAPSAVLSAGPFGRLRIGTHYAGPTWESLSGSKVVGAVVERCTPDPNHIPWLLLEAVSNEGPGIFRKVAYIQRVKTEGGNAPATPGSIVGQEARVPYTAIYLFYRRK